MIIALAISSPQRHFVKNFYNENLNRRILLFSFSLIPPDSVIAPDKPSDISGTNNDDAEHTMKLSTGNLIIG
jgi:hypothetical protein